MFVVGSDGFAAGGVNADGVGQIGGILVKILGSLQALSGGLSHG